MVSDEVKSLLFIHQRSSDNIFVGTVMEIKIKNSRGKVLENTSPVPDERHGLEEDFGQNNCGPDIHIPPSPIQSFNKGTKQKKIIEGNFTDSGPVDVGVKMDDIRIVDDIDNQQQIHPASSIIHV